ncbi:MAG: GvpL/GvpF family gas vesicle protein [Polyangiaceae bacterium]|nr:GvpL/GvpF family gas vesicle protein [Polyangiaceae bacterium]
MEATVEGEGIALAERGIYLYCFARLDSLPPLDGGGVEGGQLFVEPHRRVAAVLSDVRLEDFTGPEAERNLQTLEWLTPRVLRHEEVIQRVLERSPVLPARFATIFASRERVVRLLAAHHDTIADFLDGTAGTDEWGIKLYLDRDKAMSRLAEESRAAQEAEPSVSPGLRYMQERRLRAEADVRLQR